jgi:hypothetical protein
MKRIFALLLLIVVLTAAGDITICHTDCDDEGKHCTTICF